MRGIFSKGFERPSECQTLGIKVRERGGRWEGVGEGHGVGWESRYLDALRLSHPLWMEVSCIPCPR
jgi:hypothetical protein